MEKIIFSELVKNAHALHKKLENISFSYQETMKNALASFEKSGIPTKNNEDWKYTNIAKNLSPRFFEEKNPSTAPVPECVVDKRAMIIFNNGIFNPLLSVIPDGIEFDTLPLESDFFDAFSALNYASVVKPIALKILKNSSFEYPISIVHQTDDSGVNKIISPKISITAHPFSKAAFVEIFVSTNKPQSQYTTNAVTSFNLLENSSIEHVKIQNEALQSVHIGLTKASVAKNAFFKSYTLDFGIQTARHNIDVHLNDHGSESTVHGIYALSNTQHVDVFSSINHNSPHTTSEQLFKGVLAGESHGAFTGKIVIKQDAQKSNSAQLNKNLIVSKKAHVDTRPQLLVHADDVKCAHGATIGQLSREEEFYLESRGIKKEHAKRMLMYGFSAEVIYKIENKDIRALSEKLLIKNFEEQITSDVNL